LALAAGCTAVWTPSEFTPLCAFALVKVMHSAGVPKGVFDLVNGDGPTVGAALCKHPDVNMVSFAGSTLAGILVAEAAAAHCQAGGTGAGGKSAQPRMCGKKIARDTRKVLLSPDSGREMSSRSGW
jgi:aldehyde dehydrogenase (NAD+)